MVRLDDMRVFSAVANVGSISGAAKVLGSSKQTVSRRLEVLEQALGVELARRTTRTLTLTEVGRAYAARCAEVVRLADEANSSAASLLDEVRGTLRVTADATFGEAFLPALVTAFLNAHPDVSIEVMLTARKVDLVEEGFDVAFRVGAPPDVAHLAATHLGPAQLTTVASSAYVDRAGAPATPADLSNHQCIAVVPTLSATSWPFALRDGIQLVPVPARARVNGLAMARHAAVAGAGITQLPAFSVADDIAAGRLLVLLESFAPEVGGVHVVYPHSRLLAPKVSAFVALAVQRFAEEQPLAQDDHRP